jgi:hypothetical protein
MDVDTILRALNLLLLPIMGWVIIIERRLSRVEGFIERCPNCQPTEK